MLLRRAFCQNECHSVMLPKSHLSFNNKRLPERAQESWGYLATKVLVFNSTTFKCMSLFLKFYECCDNVIVREVIWAKLMRRATALAVPVCRLSWFNSIYFDAIHSWNLRRSHKLQKNIKTTILEIQGHSMSFKVIDVYTNKKLVTILLVMTSSMSLPICNRFQATRANSSKITTGRFFKMYVLC